MKVSAPPLAMLLIVSLSGCYPLYLGSLRMRESSSERREERQQKKPMPQTAVEYAPKPAPAPPPAVAAGGGEVGRILRVKFEDASPVQTYGLADVSRHEGVLDNPLTEWLRRGGGGMSATVIRQMYDGRLLVRGQKALSGDGAGYVQLEGIVDPRDIDDGAVLSNRMAEPRLSYYGGRGGARPAEVAELARFFQGGGNIDSN